MIPLVFGARYAESVPLARLLCTRYCISLIACPIGAISFSFGIVRINWIVNLVSLLVIVAGNLVLLPRIGPAGSATALIAAEVAGTAITASIVWARSRKHRAGVMSKDAESATIAQDSSAQDGQLPAD